MSPEVNPLVFKSDTKLLLEKAKVKVFSAFPVFFFVFFCFLFYFFVLDVYIILQELKMHLLVMWR